MANWVAVPERIFSKWCVVDRREGRTVRVIADDLSREEAHRIASLPALEESFEELLNAALEETLPAEEVRQRAIRVFLGSRGFAGAA